MAELPSIDNILCILQKCRKDKNLTFAKRLHAQICNNGLESHRAVGNHIVPMFVECGSMSDALQVFDRLVHRNVHSWTSLIVGYIESGQLHHAFNLYEKMRDDSVQPNGYTLMALLKACTRLKDLEMGREIHQEISQKRLQRDVFVGSSLVNMYAKCGSLAEALDAFDKLPVRNVVSWNALIAGYAEHGPGEKALTCFERMQLEGVSPNAVTFVCILKACGGIRAIDKGRKIHTEITKRRFERDVFVGNTLVDMYARCGSITEAQETFDSLPVRNVVTWNALIAGYTENGPCQEALKCFEQMQVEGVSPNSVTFICILKACGSIGAVEKGRDIHTNIAQKGLERDVLVGSTLIDMYAKCGSLAEARQLFDNLLVRNVVSWTAIIAGYAEHGPGQESLKCFEQMQLEGVSPDAVTIVCVLKACGAIGAADRGREIHADIEQKGFARGLSVGNILIDMYAKCGSLLEARDVFDKLPVRDVVSWNAMIKGYGLNQEVKKSVQCFEDMQEQGVKPNDITFTCLLTACSRARLVLKGKEFFKILREYGIVPTIDHYTCMVDLLAKSGHLYEAEKFIETVPCVPVWTALLNGCTIHGEADLGLRCFQELVKMDPECAAPYVLMMKIYASVGRWDEAYRIEEQMKRAGAKNKPATALIEVNKEVHEFVAGTKQSVELSSMLDCLSLRMKDEEQMPIVFRPADGKDAALCEHAEKLAIAFGLLNTPQGTTLRVTKNLRMCNDCHKTISAISRIERREIIVRDTYQVHHFEKGLCSCDDIC